MGVFDSIKRMIFGEAEAVPAAPAAVSPAAASPAAAPAAPAAAVSATPAAAVDVAAILEQAVAASGQRLDWKHSIVDLMKALKLDSSLSARKELARELGYAGSTDDSATMNIWLHKAVIRKLAENGGKVPADLLD